MLPMSSSGSELPTASADLNRLCLKPLAPLLAVRVSPPSSWTPIFFCVEVIIDMNIESGSRRVARQDEDLAPSSWQSNFGVGEAIASCEHLNIPTSPKTLTNSAVQTEDRSLLLLGRMSLQRPS